MITKEASPFQDLSLLHLGTQPSVRTEGCVPKCKSYIDILDIGG